MGAYARGFVSKPIVCPGEYPERCDVVTAVPHEGEMWLTAAAAGFVPHGYRCSRHKRRDRWAVEVGAQPLWAPRRLPQRRDGAA